MESRCPTRETNRPIYYRAEDYSFSVNWWALGVLLEKLTVLYIIELRTIVYLWTGGL